MLDIILNLVKEFKQHGDVIVMNIEPRDYPVRNRFRIINEEFKSCAKYVNRYLNSLKQ